MYVSNILQLCKVLLIVKVIILPGDRRSCRLSMPLPGDRRSCRLSMPLINFDPLNGTCMPCPRPLETEAERIIATDKGSELNVIMTLIFPQGLNLDKPPLIGIVRSPRV